jgi:hypothetical protein
MDAIRRALVLAPVVLPLAAVLAVAQTAPAPVTLTPAQMEAFLRTATIAKKSSTDKGVTRPIRATLTDGTFTHDAQIQSIDESRSLFEAGKATEVGFRDSYKFNIAGYRLAQRLGLKNVPMSVERRVDGKTSAITWWVDDVQMDETARLKLKSMGENADRVSKQMHVMRVWDELIQNRDRNQGNILWTKDWTLWMIDHTRAFRIGESLLKPDDLTRCDRALLEALRTLTAADMEEVAKGGMLTRTEWTAVLKRRDRIIKHFEDRIAQRGEATVLFSM